VGKNKTASVEKTELIEAATVEVVRTLSYFAEDGNYGSASGLTIMETTHWNELDWEILEGASDGARPEVARVLTESYEPNADEAALRAKLASLGVDLTEYEAG
jgi:hypothetical protein